MVRAHEWDAARRLARLPARRRPWWTGHPAPTAALRLEWVAGAPFAVLGVDGDLVARTAGLLEPFLTSAPTAGWSRLDLDLSGVGRLDSAGLSALLGVRRWCAQLAVPLRIRGALPSVERVLALAGLDEPAPDGDARCRPAQDLLLF
jgi:anti-anti-sigma factor